MKLHANARLSVKGRELLVDRRRGQDTDRSRQFLGSRWWHERASDNAASWVKLALGVLLGFGAVRQWRTRPPQGEEPAMPKWMQASTRSRHRRRSGSPRYSAD
jgi:hypothetical protein